MTHRFIITIGSNIEALFANHRLPPSKSIAHPSEHSARIIQNSPPPPFRPPPDCAPIPRSLTSLARGCCGPENHGPRGRRRKRGRGYVELDNHIFSRRADRGAIGLLSSRRHGGWFCQNPVCGVSRSVCDLAPLPPQIRLIYMRAHGWAGEGCVPVGWPPGQIPSQADTRDPINWRRVIFGPNPTHTLR